MVAKVVISHILSLETSSLLKSPSNCSNSFSKSQFTSINSTKLDGDLHPTLRSLGQFLLTKINF
jgi:hypothetical protein